MLNRFPVYALLLYVGLVLALVSADFMARRTGVDPTRLVAAFFITLPFMLVGARLLDVFSHWSYFRARPREILKVRGGGAALYGAVPPAVLLSIPLSGWVGVSFGAYWDLAVVAVLVGMVPTRLGCLLMGCCAGRRSGARWALRSCNAHGVRARRIPVPLFEAALGGALLIVLAVLWNRMPFPGAVAGLAFVGYALGRLALDGLREEHVARAGGLGEYQWISIALLAIAVAGLAVGGGSGAKVLGPMASSEAGVLPLIASILLLIPIVHVFRFQGCSLIFAEGEPQVTHLLQMIVTIPDIGSGAVSARMRLELEPDMEELANSPFELVAAGTDGAGNLLFEAVEEARVGDYLATCTVSREGVPTRVGVCSGALTGPGLVVAFIVQPNDGPTDLSARFCFEPS